MFISHALPYRAGIPLRTQPYFPLVPARVTLRRNAHPGKPFPDSLTHDRRRPDDRPQNAMLGHFSGSAPFRPAPAFRQNRHAATFLRSQRCPQAIGFRPEIPILVTLRVVQPRERHDPAAGRSGQFRAAERDAANRDDRGRSVEGCGRRCQGDAPSSPGLECPCERSACMGRRRRHDRLSGRLSAGKSPAGRVPRDGQGRSACAEIPGRSVRLRNGHGERPGVPDRTA